MPMQRFYEQTGEYISLERLLDHLRENRLVDGRALPLLIWGGAGTGKCVVGSTLIEHDGMLTSIAEMWARHAGPVTDRDSDGGEWAAPNRDLWVTSIASDGRLQRRRVVRLYRQPVHETGRRVKLDDGSELTMTKRHRLLGLDGWTRDIAVGDHVSVPARLPEPKGASSLHESLVIALAWQLGEGWEQSSRHQVSITQKDVAQLRRIREHLLTYGDYAGLRMNSMPIYEQRGTPELAVISRDYVDHLRAQGYDFGRLSAHKRIPDLVMGADNASVRTFLREFFAAEGHVNPRSELEISSASEQVIRQLATMLRRFGIWLRIGQTMRAATNGSGLKRPYWRGRITGSSLQRFRADIGIACARKQRAFDALPLRDSNTNTEGIPVSDLLNRTCALTGIPKRRLRVRTCYFRAGRGASRPVAAQALAAVGSMLDGTMLREFEAGSFSNQHNHPGNRAIRSALSGAHDEVLRTDVADRLADRLQREVFYARVTSVEPVELDGYVYDLEVEDTHNYVAGGVITHNTQQIKAYAKSRGLAIRTYHPAHDTSGADIVGEAIIDEKTGQTTRAIPEFLPREGDPPGILFVDELNRAPELVLAGLMEIFGEGTISQSNWELPKNWQLVAAANPSELGYQVTELDSAMVDRMLHYAPGWDAPGWAKWALSTERFNPQVIDFALANPDVVETGEAQLPLEIEGKLKATPRSLEYFNALYKPDLSEGMLRVIAGGILGREASERFLAAHLGEQPMSARELLQPTYDAKLARWINDNQEQLISATTKRLVSELVGRPVVDDAVKRLGRYLAMLPSMFRDEAWSLLQRSAADWHDPLFQSAAKWRTHFGKQGRLGAGEAPPLS